jgi:flagellar basal body-associated protein FliL
MSDNEKDKKKISKKRNAVFILIVMIFFVLIIVGLALWFESEDQKMLDKGCTPKAWNSFGHPSIWSCPVK